MQYLTFLLTLLDHLEHKVSPIRERMDLSKFTLKILDGILKTYELELFQKRSIQGHKRKMTDVSNVLVTSEPNEGKSSSFLKIDEEVVCEEENTATEEIIVMDVDENNFYTIEELEKMYNK